MLGSTLILILTTLGQAPPGADGPAPLSPPPGARRQWVTIDSPVDGKPVQVYGWAGPDGRPAFNPAEYPQFAARKPAPAPAPTPAPAPAPAPKPAAAPSTSTPVVPTGVVAEKLPHVSRGQAWYGGAVPASDGDSARHTPAPGKAQVYLTLVGGKPECRAVLASLERDPAYLDLKAEMGDRLAVNSYRPANPLAAEVGLVGDGRPDIVIQDATGKELARHQADPGPSTLVAELRRADPSYRPGHGRDRPDTLPEWAVLVGALALIAILVGLSRKAA